MSVPNEIKELVDRFKNNYNDYKKPTYLEAELLSYQKMGRKKPGNFAQKLKVRWFG